MHPRVVSALWLFSLAFVGFTSYRSGLDGRATTTLKCPACVQPPAAPVVAPVAGVATPEPLLPAAASLPKVQCESFDEQSSYCAYERSLCYSKSGGFTVLTTDRALAGKPVPSYGNLGPPPFHPPWSKADFSGSGPEYLRVAGFPFRHFVPTPKHYQLQDSFLAKQSIEWVSDPSVILAFDASNYNIYHWVNTMFAAFLARLRYLEGWGHNDRPLQPSLQRLFAGEGFKHVFALRGPVTDWQQNFAEIALGDNGTSFHYSPQISMKATSEVMCFEQAVIPGATLYLSNGIANAQLLREIAARRKGIVAHRDPAAPVVVTWFHRSDKRKVLNMDEAQQWAQQLFAKLSPRLKRKFSLELVHWEETDEFKVQASQMSKTSVYITTHGSALNHCLYMETGGSVIEIDAYQFRYELDDLIVLQQGHHYLRYTADLKDTQHPGHPIGHDPFPSHSAGRCNSDGQCLLARRDANIRLEKAQWLTTLELAIDAVL